MRRRVIFLVTIIGAGILSRLFHTGWILLDKYLGDGLYAAMVFTLIELVWLPGLKKAAAVSMTVMTALELFQLTGIPASLLQSEHLVVRIVARLMGTQFSWLDLVAYGAGIGLLVCWQQAWETRA